MDNEALVLDLVEWVAGGPRTYTEVMAAWRTSCPRLTIWEDALDAGLVERDDAMVRVTGQGLQFLGEHGRAATQPRRGNAGRRMKEGEKAS